MICPECKKEDKKSNVYIDNSYCTDMYCSPYYDSEGKYHIHDMNKYVTQYHCSNGHKFIKEKYKECPSCDFNKEK